MTNFWWKALCFQFLRNVHFESDSMNLYHIDNIYECNIYWENKTEEEKISEEAAQGGHALKKADQWLKDAQNANLENLSPEEVNKTVQSILSFFSPLNNNNSKTEVKIDKYA